MVLQSWNSWLRIDGSNLLELKIATFFDILWYWVQGDSFYLCRIWANAFGGYYMSKIVNFPLAKYIYLLLTSNQHFPEHETHSLDVGDALEKFY